MVFQVVGQVSPQQLRELRAEGVLRAKGVRRPSPKQVAQQAQADLDARVEAKRAARRARRRRAQV